MKIAQLFTEDQNVLERDYTGMTPAQIMAQKAANKSRGKAIGQKIAKAKQQAQATPATNQAGAGVFGQMAKSLSGEPAQTPAPAASASTPSSTGGTITPTATGQQHTASAQNPNQTAPAAAPAQQPASGATGKSGALGGKISGALQKMKQGYQAGKASVRGGSSSTASGNAPADVGSGSATAGGDFVSNIYQQATQQIAVLSNRVSALEKAVGIAEEYKFSSKFLGKDI